MKIIIHRYWREGADSKYKPILKTSKELFNRSFSLMTKDIMLDIIREILSPTYPACHHHILSTVIELVNVDLSLQYYQNDRLFKNISGLIVRESKLGRVPVSEDISTITIINSSLSWSAAIHFGAWFSPPTFVIDTCGGCTIKMPTICDTGTLCVISATDNFQWMYAYAHSSTISRPKIDLSIFRHRHPLQCDLRNSSAFVAAVILSAKTYAIYTVNKWLPVARKSFVLRQSDFIHKHFRSFRAAYSRARIFRLHGDFSFNTRQIYHANN